MLFRSILNFHPYNRCDFETKDNIYFHIMYSFDYNELPGSILEEQSHSFNYQDEENPNVYPTWGIKYLLPVNERGNTNASKTFSWNAGGGLDLGLGFNYASKSLTIGGNYNYNADESEGLINFKDLNGDGYPHKFIRGEEKLQYRLRIPSNDNSILFSEIRDIFDKQTFQYSSGSTDNWGIEGQIPIAGASGNWSDTRSATSVYMADFDADGLTDIIDNGQIYVNRLDENEIGRASCRERV